MAAPSVEGPDYISPVEVSFYGSCSGGPVAALVAGAHPCIDRCAG
jgi:hypothetical protein